MKHSPSSCPTTAGASDSGSGSSGVAGSMVARASELVEGLSASEPQRRMTALRCIKNAIIGNKAKKTAFLSAGALPRVLHLLLSEGNPDVQVQCATALGSFAYGTPAGLKQLVDAGGMEGLMGTMSSPEPKVVEAGIRALKLVFAQAACPVPHQCLVQPSSLTQLVRLLSDQNRPEVMEAAAAVLASCCTSAEEQLLMTEAGVADACLQLALSARKPLQATALQLFSRLLPGNAPACQHLLSCRPLAETLLQLLRDSDPRTRLSAATCVTHLASCVPSSTSPPSAPAASPATGAGAGAEAGAGVSTAVGRLVALPTSAWDVHACLSTAQLLHLAKQAALPVLLRLLSDPHTLEQVPPLLARLLEGSEELQKAAVDADAVRHLAQLLSSQPSTSSPPQGKPESPASSPAPAPGAGAGTAMLALAAGKAEVAGAGADIGLNSDSSSSALMQEGVLRALGNMCLTWNDGRKQLIEAKVLKQVVKSLEHPSDGVRAAAALCVMGLSRSISTLRSCLLETEVAEVLCRLLHDKCVDVQVKVVATLCNLLLEFSSVKEAVLAQGALATMTSLVASTVPELRRNSCCALRNLAFQAEARVRAALMAGLPWRQLRGLLNHPDAAVQEQAVCMLRNLVMDSDQHIRAVLEWAGADLLACLEEKLDPSRIQVESNDTSTSASDASVGSSHAAATLHALYTVANLLTGCEAHKDAVMASNLPALLAHYLRPSPHVSSELRVSALWCIINLTWPESEPSGGGSAAAHRVAKLRELGVEESLRSLMEDRDMDVKERARTAYLQLTSRSAC